MSPDQGRLPSAGPLVDPMKEAFATGSFRDRLWRLRSRAWFIVQIAVGATLAWVLAHDVLRHQLPFFAPITAMVCLGLTYGDRVRRIVELTFGVAIGIFVGDLFVHLFGTGFWQIFVVCVVAMSLAVLAGAGQLLMMQAGIQGVVITILVAGEGQAFSRWVDALVGGSVALIIAVLAPMRSTTLRPRERAIALVGELARILTDTAQALRARDADRAGRALSEARAASDDLEALRGATAEARAAARLAPLLSGEHRDQLEEIGRLITPLDYAVRNLRVLARRSQIAILEEEYVPQTYVEMVVGLAQAAATIQEHLEHQTPLSQAREDLVHLARQSTWSHPRAGLSAEVLRAQVRSTVVDLLVLSGVPIADARRRVPPTRDEVDPIGG